MGTRSVGSVARPDAPLRRAMMVLGNDRGRKVAAEART
jgi:hypothetical protein